MVNWSRRTGKSLQKRSTPMADLSRSKDSLSSQAYRIIFERLCDGTISPGDLLSESRLAAELKMSRTPVREALHLLAGENWLEIKNGVGAYVKPVSTRDIEDLYEVRILLEVQAAKTAIHRLPLQEITALEEAFRLLTEMDPSDAAARNRRSAELDWAVHELMIRYCQNQYIRTILQNYIFPIKRYLFFSVGLYDDPALSARQHLELLEAMKKRDAALLAQRLEAHLAWAMGYIRGQ